MSITWCSDATNHNISTHAETFFHFPLTDDLSDECGNVDDLLLGNGTGGASLQHLASCHSTVGGGMSVSTGYARVWDGINTSGRRNWSVSPAMDFGDGTTLGVGDNFTLAFLARRVSVNSFMAYTANTYCVSLRAAPDNYGISMGPTSSGGNAFRLVYGPSTLIISETIAGSSNNYDWNHVCCTISGTQPNDDFTVRFYLNGVEATNSPATNQANMTGAHTSHTLRVGTYGDTGSFLHRGHIRSVIGIRKTLSGAEVAALSTATRGA